MSRLIKATTGLTGFPVVRNPHKHLLALYEKIERELSRMPPDAGYRRHTQALIDDRLKHVNSEPDIQKLEEKINCGQIEEVIMQAEEEYKTARGFNHYQPWTSPSESLPPDQWKWPI